MHLPILDLSFFMLPQGYGLHRMALLTNRTVAAYRKRQKKIGSIRESSIDDR